ncbi:MAG: galactose mutarotase [Erysipelotrichaceae bacterium]|nr:galactose mutarotase [Erysipelotrichaceae bacterium]
MSKLYGKTADGQMASLYTIESEQIRAEITDFGAVLVALWVKDKNGKATDVVLAHDSLEGYFNNPECFGSIIAPVANRTENACFTIDGTTYHMLKNEGENNLHSDTANGAHKRLWKVVDEKKDELTLEIEMADGDMGFPGNRKINVTYSVKEGTLGIKYRIVSDKATVFNPTNHSYFNLGGYDSGSVFDHYLKLDCDYYTPVKPGSIPTGEIAEVTGTPMDFTKGKTIGEDFDLSFEQLKLTNGYDHNFVINDYDGSLRHFATLCSEKTGIIMDAYTTMPGVQLYTGNFVDVENGINGTKFTAHDGLCLETQFFPNSANQPGFVSPRIDGNKEYCCRTEYSFKTE